MKQDKELNFSNSATRLINILSKARESPDNTSTQHVWADTFGIQNKDIDQVYQRLSLFRYELDLVEKKMVETNFSKNLYKPYLQQIRNVISPDNLAATWSSYRTKIDETNMLALRYCSEIIDSEPTADFNELERVLSELIKFRESLEKNKIDGIIYDFVMNQIDNIQQAINCYPIQGKNSIKKAYRNLLVDFTEKEEDLKTHENTNEEKQLIKQLGDFLRRFNKAAETIIKTDNNIKGILNTVKQKIELIHPLTKLLENFYDK